MTVGITSAVAKHFWGCRSTSYRVLKIILFFKKTLIIFEVDKYIMALKFFSRQWGLFNWALGMLICRPSTIWGSTKLLQLNVSVRHIIENINFFIESAGYVLNKLTVFYKNKVNYYNNKWGFVSFLNYEPFSLLLNFNFTSKVCYYKTFRRFGFPVK